VSGYGPPYRGNEADLYEVNFCSHGAVRRNGTGHRPVATEASISARFPVTTD